MRYSWGEDNSLYGAEVEAGIFQRAVRVNGKMGIGMESFEADVHAGTVMITVYVRARDSGWSDATGELKR